MVEDTTGGKLEAVTWRTDSTVTKTGIDSCALEGHVLSGRQSTTHKTKDWATRTMWSFHKISIPFSQVNNKHIV